MSGSGEPRQPEVLSVSQLTSELKQLLEYRFSGVWVSGEISNLSRPQSGHIYLTLKDDQSQLRAAIWRSLAQTLRFDLSDGLEVVCQGDIDVYPPRGSYQLIIRQLEPKGLGALQLAFRQLHQRLQAEGLFDVQRKRPLPRFPRRVAFVTSPSGAAVRDFLQVIDRRWPDLNVQIIPCRVQGEGAAMEIQQAIGLANRLRPGPDVIVVGRGGGSMEDLWCFNEERVVRAIFDSRIPVVSAVGHEIDVTLSDLVADVRALTPSEAGELVIPLKSETRLDLRQLGSRMGSVLGHRAQLARHRIEALAARRVLRRPLDMVHQVAGALDETGLTIRRNMRRIVEASQQTIDHAAARLQLVSPLNVLARGYSVTLDEEGNLLSASEQVTIGQRLHTRLAHGAVVSRVESTQGGDLPRPETRSPGTADRRGQG